MASGSDEKVARAREVKALLAISCDESGIDEDSKVLYPADYSSRADALVEARRLVGPIEIEKL